VEVEAAEQVIRRKYQDKIYQIRNIQIRVADDYEY
jgi:hypothetical protein